MPPTQELTAPTGTPPPSFARRLWAVSRHTALAEPALSLPALYLRAHAPQMEGVAKKLRHG